MTDIENPQVEASEIHPDDLKLGMIETFSTDPEDHKFALRVFGALLPNPPNSIYWGSTTGQTPPNTNISWGMMKNNSQGDCVEACYGHLFMLWNIFSGRGKIFPTDDQCLDLYYEMGYWNWARTGVGTGTSFAQAPAYMQDLGVACGAEPCVYKGAINPLLAANNSFKLGERVYVTINANLYATFVRSQSTANINSKIQTISIGLDTPYLNSAPGSYPFMAYKPPYVTAFPSNTVVVGSTSGLHFIINNKSYHTVTTNGNTTTTVTESPPIQATVHKLVNSRDALLGTPPLYEATLGWTQTQVNNNVAYRNRVLKLCIQYFGGIPVAIQLPLSCKTKWATTVWDVVPTTPPYTGVAYPGSWGGHCILMIGYDVNYIYFVTWGKVCRMTWNFFNSYITGGYAMVATDWINPTTNLSPSGFSLATLNTYVQNIQTS